MKTSETRILTTHTGSLPRNKTLTELLLKQERGEPVDAAELEREMDKAVRHVVQKQTEAGIDIVNDGEQPRVGFQIYVPLRMQGFGGESQRPTPQDMKEFPDYVAILQSRGVMQARSWNAPQAVEEVRYEDLSGVKTECDIFARATGEGKHGFAERFMTAASPGIIATTMLNVYYDSHEKYVTALAREMKKEYEYIAGQGFILQIDAPDLAMERTFLFQDKSLREFQEIVEMHIAALNSALENIPREQVRLHVCWGNYDGPHIYDVALSDILPILYEAKVGALSIEMANPRHQHEYKAFEKHPLPDEMALIPGTIDSMTNYVEHPEIVADRIGRVVEVVGDRSRVIAGVDCGFGTFAGWEMVAPSVVWAKLKSLGEGAALATKRLWG